KDKYYFLNKSILSKCDTWFSSRMKQDAFSEGFSMVQAAKTYSENHGGLYFRPKHYGKKAILSSKVVSIENPIKISQFDTVIKLTSLGNKLKLLLPTKKHRHFNSLSERGKLSKSIVLSEKYVQVSFEIKTDKKKDSGKKIGIDIGLSKLAVTSEHEVIGSDIKYLIQKLHQKKKCSKAYYRCKKEINYYINKEL